MRTYALLLGTLLTTASSYVADIAVRSAGLPKADAILRAAADPPGAPIWYGGVLKPITIETYRYPRQALTLRALERFGGSAPCGRSTQAALHAISAE